jgi:hypothetical protein
MLTKIQSRASASRPPGEECAPVAIGKPVPPLSMQGTGAIGARFLSQLTLLVCLFGVLTNSILPSKAAVGGQTVDEYKLKAVYLFNFGVFTEWPREKAAHPDESFVVGVIGNNGVAAELERFVAEKRQVGGRKLLVRRLRANADFSECHILFVGSDIEPGAVLTNLKTAGKKSEGILTVGESEKFIERGGMVNFVFVKDNLRYELSPSVAEQAGLKVSAQLLRAALKVNASPAEKGGLR